MLCKPMAPGAARKARIQKEWSAGAVVVEGGGPCGTGTKGWGRGERLNRYYHYRSAHGNAIMTPSAVATAIVTGEYDFEDLLESLAPSVSAWADFFFLFLYFFSHLVFVFACVRRRNIPLVACTSADARL